MFNTNLKLGSNTQDVTFNTTSTGHLQKSNPKSRFIKFQLGSKMANCLFAVKEPPYMYKEESYPYKKVLVTILQTLIFGDNWFLCEVIENESLEEKIKEED